MARLAGAVTVITTRDESGLPWGFTATAFCSLSLEPPLVLFCLSQDADCYQAFLNGHCFAVNLLHERQRDLAQRFATRGRTKYEGIAFTRGRLDLPLLPEAPTTLECSIWSVYPGGDHSIFTGLVEHSAQAEAAPEERPLLYYTQTDGTFAPLIESEEQNSL